MLAIAGQLIARNYDVCFVSGSGYRQQAETLGAKFVPVEGYGDYYDLTSWDLDADCTYLFGVFSYALAGGGSFHGN